jgi:hypothetical protein
MAYNLKPQTQICTLELETEKPEPKDDGVVDAELKAGPEEVDAAADRSSMFQPTTALAPT